MKLPMLSDDDKLGEIRRIYFAATRESIQADLIKALDLLRSMSTEEQRERATVYMEGLNEMRKDWAGRKKGVGGAGRAGGAGGAGREKKKRF